MDVRSPVYSDGWRDIRLNAPRIDGLYISLLDPTLQPTAAE
jgi:hypothetical protein